MNESTKIQNGVSTVIANVMFIHKPISLNARITKRNYKSKSKC